MGGGGGRWLIHLSFLPEYPSSPIFHLNTQASVMLTITVFVLNSLTAVTAVQLYLSVFAFEEETFTVVKKLLKTERNVCAHIILKFVQISFQFMLNRSLPLEGQYKLEVLPQNDIIVP